MKQQKMNKMNNNNISKINIFYTVLIFINNFATGLTLNMIGPSFVDLSHIYNTSMNTIAYFQIANCAGYLIGSLASFVYRWIDRQLLLSLLLTTFAISVALLPFYHYFAIAILMIVFGLTGVGAWDSAMNVWLVEMWPVGNTALLQANTFMYGLGTIVAPLLVSPFLHGDTNVSKDGGTLLVEDRIESLVLPFSIAGVMQVIVPNLFFLMYFVCGYEKVDKSSPNCETNQLSRRTSPNRTKQLGLMGLCIAFYIAGENGYLNFSTSMLQMMSIKLSAGQAAHVQSIMSTTYTVGRLITAFVSMKLKIDHIITYHYAIQICAMILLFCGRHNLTLIYIGSATLGFGFSAIFPGMFAFTEQKLGLTDRVSSFYVCLVGGMSLVTPMVLSQAFNLYPPILMILSGTFCTISFTLFIAARIWISLERKTFVITK